MKKRKEKEKRFFLIGVVIFAAGFFHLCQRMSVIKLGYDLGKEKNAYKSLANINRTLYFERESLKSPYYLNSVACGKLGLNAGADVMLRKINLVPPDAGKDKNRAASRLCRIFGLNSRAEARPSRK